MSGWQVQSIFHFTVTATNFERSLDFYTALGFSASHEGMKLHLVPASDGPSGGPAA